ncbi:MAG: hypothetical protein VXZ73_01060 [Pseudomonadota bacterium]|nr:hypothetical protein [Pseudomonadota bacterium]MEC8977353.1 hypothetical protein [Pseudomonadota bacterium]
MKSANHDAVQPILSEQDLKNVPRIIKSLSKENWVLLIQHEAAVQHLFDVLSKESLDGREEFVSIFVDKLADSNLTSTENFIKIIKNYHSHLFRHHFDEKFQFYNGLRQVLRDNTAFAQGFCTDFFRDSSTGADEFFRDMRFKHYFFSEDQSQEWGDDPLYYTSLNVRQHVFELALKVTTDHDEKFLLELLKKCTCEYQSIYLIRWAIMFNHHQIIVDYLNCLEKNNMTYLNRLLSFYCWPECESSYAEGLNLQWREGIPLEGIETANSIYMMALLFNANAVIERIHCLHRNDLAPELDYLMADNVSLDIMHNPDIAQQCFSSEVIMLKNMVRRCIEVESSCSSLEEAVEKRPENETPLCFYIKKNLKQDHSSDRYYEFFMQRFVMAILFDVDGSFEVFPDLCTSFFEASHHHSLSYSGSDTLETMSSTGEAFVYDGQSDFGLLYNINRVFSHFFQKVDRPFLSLDRYKTLLKVVYQSIARVHRVLGHCSELTYLSPLNCLSETLISTELSSQAFLDAHKHAINERAKPYQFTTKLPEQDAIAWITKTDSIMFTDYDGKVMHAYFTLKEEIYKHLSSLVFDADLLADIRQSLFDMYMYRASASVYPPAYYEIARRHLQDVGKYLSTVKVGRPKHQTVGAFDRVAQEEVFDKSCWQFIEKISGLSMIEVEYRVNKSGSSLAELKSLLLNEALSYAMFSQFTLSVIQSALAQPENETTPAQISLGEKASLFAQLPSAPDHLDGPQSKRSKHA